MKKTKKVGMFRNYNNVLNHLLPVYEKTNNLLKADFFLTWNDLVEPNKKNVELCKKHGIPSIVMEHGMKAVSDYDTSLRDVHNNMGGKPFIADHMMVWGQKSKDIMVNSGVDKNKVTVVGSPILKDYIYIYKNKNGEEKKVPFNAGAKVIDPSTKTQWDLECCEIKTPKRDPNGSLIVFITNHDWSQDVIKKTSVLWEHVKKIPNVLVLSSTNYLNKEDNNPFLELLNIENYNERIQRIICSDTRKPTNINLIKNILYKSKVVITAIPGTINGLAWGMDVPTLVPKMDWHWRKDGKTIYDINDGDYSCEIEDIPLAVHNILKEDTKKKAREEAARYFMGTDVKNTIESMVKVINEV